MDAILRTIADPDLQGVLIMYPKQHYVHNPHGGQNMQVWTDVHTADDWWSLQVLLKPAEGRVRQDVTCPIRDGIIYTLIWVERSHVTRVSPLW